MIKKLVIIFFLFTVVSHSANYLDSFSSYRSQVKTALNVSTSDVTYLADTTLNQLIREGVNEIIPMVQAKKQTFSDTTLARKGAIALDSLAVGVRYVYWSKNDSVKTLLYVPKEQWYQLEVKILNVNDKENPYNNRPSYYDYDESYIYLYPVPYITGDTIKYDAFSKIKNISAVTALSDIPVQYRNVILKYVIFKAAESKQHPLTQQFEKNYLTSAQNAFNLIRKAQPVETSTP